ncbi:uncharacterized protein LOC107796006 [Nicotiana tabacum]|uniref:Uncharacterized protein LOC107796006 n=1 Tax=Nicotiana tabacum TaxID=4097 RepID=A0A1S4AC17_TOBAC|nr:uncharacterized protein LOC104107191 [Nicotiana tomentosiformis]XP_016474197.1 PREDICTED: uncharacterized protein LOC107796006 [Nicotiana tabacum]
MQEWLKITFVAVSSGILVLIMIIIIQRRCCPRKRRDSNSERPQNLQNGISKLHTVSLHHLDRDGTKKTNYYVFKQGTTSAKNVFNWSDHPSLVTDAVENGWSRFAFTTYAPSPSVRSARSLLGSCGVGENGSELEVDMNWEICQGSADFMQKIRFNSGLKKLSKSSNLMSASSVIKTSLPLPGPPLGNSSFPQEAYFEITILPYNQEDRELMGKAKEDNIEKIKLIREDSNSKANSESLVHVTSSQRQNGHKKIQESKDNFRSDFIVLSIGLTNGGSLPPKIPGSYSGSIGFNSNGSVFLDGMKLVYESQREEWGKAEKVIGCGYNPSQKKVFFTVDSLLVHEIRCKSEEFGNPLYPTLAANGDILVLVNLGQSVFRYPPANFQRTPNPCFIGPLANSPVLGYEDSKELFSMGRIDAQWLNRSTTTTRSNNNTVNSLKQVLDYDMESEGDLFEIVLDNNSSSRSPNPL